MGTTPSKEFFKALNSKDNKRALQCIQHPKFDVNSVDNASIKKITVIQAAVEHGDTVLIEAVVTRGANGNFLYENGESGLWRTVQAGNIPVARQLLSAGADTNFAMNGVSILEAALNLPRTQSREIVPLLLANGGNPNSLCKNGDSLLMKAVRAGNDVIADSLIKAKADVNFTWQSYRCPADAYESALSIALKNHKLKLFQTLIEAEAKWDFLVAGTLTWPGTETNFQYTYGYRSWSMDPSPTSTLLWAMAIHETDPSYLRAILMSAKSVNEFAIGLHIAVHHDRPQHLELLIDFGVPINHIEKDMTPLGLAVRSGKLEMVKTLVKKGSKDPSAVYLSVKYHQDKDGHHQICTYLIENGFDPNVPHKRDPHMHSVSASATRSMETPLELAASLGETAIVACLLNAKAKGEHAMEVALKNEHWNIVLQLINAGRIQRNNAYSALIAALQKEKVDVALALLHTDFLYVIHKNKKSDFLFSFQPTKGKSTPLHLAARLANVELVRLILKRGENIDAVDEKGRTALHIAVSAAAATIVASLLAAGASLQLGLQGASISAHMRTYCQKLGTNLTAIGVSPPSPRMNHNQFDDLELDFHGLRVLALGVLHRAHWLQRRQAAQHSVDTALAVALPDFAAVAASGKILAEILQEETWMLVSAQEYSLCMQYEQRRVTLVAQLDEACSQLSKEQDYGLLGILAKLLSDTQQMNFINLTAEDGSSFGRLEGWQEKAPVFPGIPSKNDRWSFLGLVQAGRIHDVYNAICNGYNVNAHDITTRKPEEKAMAALYHATQREDEAMVRLLFAAGAVKALKLSAEGQTISQIAATSAEIQQLCASTKCVAPLPLPLRGSASTSRIELQKECRCILLLAAGISSRTKWIKRKETAERSLSLATRRVPPDYNMVAERGKTVQGIDAEEKLLLLSAKDFKELPARRDAAVQGLQQMCRDLAHSHEFLQLEAWAVILGRLQDLDFADARLVPGGHGDGVGDPVPVDEMVADPVPVDEVVGDPVPVDEVVPAYHDV